jgi:hypothetical protein
VSRVIAWRVERRGGDSSRDVAARIVRQTRLSPSAMGEEVVAEVEMLQSMFPGRDFECECEVDDDGTVRTVRAYVFHMEPRTEGQQAARVSRNGMFLAFVAGICEHGWVCGRRCHTTLTPPTTAVTAAVARTVASRGRVVHAAAGRDAVECDVHPVTAMHAVVPRHTTPHHRRHHPCLSCGWGSLWRCWCQCAAHV